jgi:hypothetical protein
MNNRLSRSDYVFSLVIVFMLVCIAAAFFFGVSIGQKKTEQKYLAALAERDHANKTPDAYEQQVLVSFYHNIFSEFQTFQNKWFDRTFEIERHAENADVAAIIRDLSRTADGKAKAIAGLSMPESSPLLVEAQQNYIKSLQKFAETLKQYESKASGMQPKDLLNDWAQNGSLTEAKKYALQAQSQFYAAMVKWNESDGTVKGLELTDKQSWTTQDWGQMGFLVKNNVVADILLTGNRFVPVLPQDITVRVDEWINGGQAQKWNLTDIGSLVQTLIDTSSVRPGDYLQRKQERTEGEPLPQLPFFFGQN